MVQNVLACQLAEVKFAGSENDMTFSGYGAIFGNVDSYGDVIAPGAFSDTLSRAKSQNDWPAMLSQHGSFLGGGDNVPVGVWTSMQEDSKGLVVEGKLAPTPRGQELYTLMKMQPRPAINGLSIGYVPKEWSVRTRPEEPRRTLKKVDLMEVSIVTMPANPKARVTQVKCASIREFESFLRDAGGFSRAQAAAIAAGGFKSIESMRDAGDDGQEVGASIDRLISTLTGK
ncbi:HK97 family phage prohead protease [Bradyrhizobium elkanii]|nr:HK97 family phage prohead protease [Bradyrhizobium elkanii]MCS3575406.1 HK97 family phage prohead protease [Bradyrhizobium elkanii]MCS3591903.1 HK97 family phage prohead protease [Bradyrhizobium elkanii]GEC52253.1 peptidase U35 [Bradyrhizobium elkanii]